MGRAAASSSGAGDGATGRLATRLRWRRETPLGRALSPAVRDGRRQRDARLLLGRRRQLPPRGRGGRGAADGRGGRGDRRRRRRVDAARARRRLARRGAAPGRARCSRRLAGVPVSIDTSKAEVARRALALGAELVNDVTALRGDPELAGVVADAGAYLCLMHMLGEPRTMQVDPRYDDVASEVAAFLEERLAFAVDAGRPRGARLPRPRHRLRQDGRAELRARAPARRAARARPARRDRLLAQELARADARRPGRDDRAARRQPRPPPSPRTSAARRSCACTTCARRWRRSPSPGRCRAHDDDRAARARALRLPRRRSRSEQRDGQTLRLRRLARGATEPARRPDRGHGRLPRGRRAASSEVSDGAQFQLLEALAAAVADALLERFPVDARARPRAQAAGAARPAGRRAPRSTVERRP